MDNYDAAGIPLSRTSGLTTFMKLPAASISGGDPHGMLMLYITKVNIKES